MRTINLILKPEKGSAKKKIKKKERHKKTKEKRKLKAVRLLTIHQTFSLLFRHATRQYLPTFRLGIGI